MREILIHGRGGQGGVYAADILAQAAILKSDNNTGQSFPKFGAERRGAPVKSFCRLGQGSIKRHSQIYSGDIVVVLDKSLKVDPNKEIKPEGVIIYNSATPPEIPKGNYHIFYVDATSIALKYDLKVSGQAVVNTTMMGGLLKAMEKIAGMNQLLDMASLQKAIIIKLGDKIGEKNATAAAEAFKSTKEA